MRLMVAARSALALAAGACTDDMAPRSEPDPALGLEMRITIQACAAR